MAVLGAAAQDLGVAVRELRVKEKTGEPALQILLGPEVAAALIKREETALLEHRLPVEMV